MHEQAKFFSQFFVVSYGKSRKNVFLNHALLKVIICSPDIFSQNHRMSLRSVYYNLFNNIIYKSKNPNSVAAKFQFGLNTQISFPPLFLIYFNSDSAVTYSRIFNSKFETLRHFLNSNKKILVYEATKINILNDILSQNHRMSVRSVYYDLFNNITYNS